MLAPCVRRRAGDGLAELVADRHHPPDPAVSHGLAERLGLRSPAVVLVHHDDRALGATRRPHDRGRLGHVYGQRLLRQDVQAPLQGSQDGGLVDHLRQGDDHRLRLGAVQSLFDSGESPLTRNLELVTDRRQKVRVLGHDPGHLALRARRDLLEPILPKEPQPQHEDWQSAHNNSIGEGPQLSVTPTLPSPL